MTKEPIMSPKAYRTLNLKTAHKTPLSGHLRMNKSYMIVRYFNWPGLKKDVAEFFNTCHIYQTLGKSNVKIPTATLRPIPVCEETFGSVIIDCISSLPRTKRGNKYILNLSVCDLQIPRSHPFKEQFNKKNYRCSKFPKFRLPKEIQSYQGSKFMSWLFQQTLRQLGSIRASSYDPQSQGVAKMTSLNAKKHELTV